MDFKTIIDEHYRRKDAEEAALEPKVNTAHKFIKDMNASFDKIWEYVAKGIDKNGIAGFEIPYPVGTARGTAKIIARDRIDVELYFTNFISKEDFIPRDYDNVFLHIEHFYFGMLPGQDTALSISPLDDGISIKYRFKAK